MISRKKLSFNPVINLNKRATHDYFVEKRWEAGLVLQGWEVKSLRQIRTQLRDSHVLLKNNEAWLLGCHIVPLKTASPYVKLDPNRSRKLLLNRRELNNLLGGVGRRGYTIIALKLYWKDNRVKVEIGLAKGKKEYEKRASLKDREWQREKSRWTRHNELS